MVRGPKFGERLAPALRLLTERYTKISATLKDNEKLKKSEARLRLIIEALPTGVVLIDQSGKVLAMNAAGVALFGGVSPQEIVGRTFATLLQVEDQPGFQDFLKKAGGGEEACLNFSGLIHDDPKRPPSSSCAACASSVTIRGRPRCSACSIASSRRPRRSTPGPTNSISTSRA